MAVMADGPDHIRPAVQASRSHSLRHSGSALLRGSTTISTHPENSTTVYRCPTSGAARCHAFPQRHPWCLLAALLLRSTLPSQFLAHGLEIRHLVPPPPTKREPHWHTSRSIDPKESVMGRTTDSAPGSSPRVHDQSGGLAWLVGSPRALSHGLPGEVSSIFSRPSRACTYCPKSGSLNISSPAFQTTLSLTHIRHSSIST